MIRLAIAAMAAMALSGCLAVKPDMSNFRGVALPPGPMTAQPVPISLYVFEDYAELNRLCTLAKHGPDATVAPLKGFFGCAINWPKGCAIFAPANTAYEVKGHEFLHCMAQAADDEKRSQLPPHFQKVKP
jgi:hypothetical protein